MKLTQFPLRAVLTGSFLLLTPLVTYLLILMKGIPEFATNQQGQVLIWVYAVTWVPSLLAGLLLSGVVSMFIQKNGYFHKPYDFGRCFSLGAIAGAISEAIATAFYRAVTHHPFSDFWLAGAMIAGCLSGAVLTSIILAGVSKRSQKTVGPSARHS
jgi:hypothetical protein